MKTEEMPILDLSGSASEIGCAHGEALREKISQIIGQWRETASLPMGVSFDDAINIFLTETGFTEQIRLRTPALLDEIDGIAKGANQDPRYILAFQFGDEARWFFRDRFEAAKSPDGDNCSSLGARGEHHRATIVAENVDVGDWADGFQTVLRLQDPADGAQTLVFTVAGMVGMNGVSGRGIAICCNTLLQLDTSIRGLPVAAIVRGVLACRSFEEAEDFVRTVQHASGQNYLIGGRHNIVNIESSGAGSVVYKWDHRNDRVLHTNHPLAQPPSSRYAAREQHDRLSAGDIGYAASSHRRYDSLSSRFSKSVGPTSVSEVMDILRARDDADYPVCLEASDASSDAMTIASTIFELGDKACLYISAGPPSKSNYMPLEASASS